MNAVEFFKKYGWEECQWVCNDLFSTSDGGTYQYDKDIIDVGDLKRLIEAHELVEKYGGLEKAREMKIGDFPLSWIMNTSKLEQAIADVEKCQ